MDVPVLGYVVPLGEYKQAQTEAGDGDEDFVAGAVEGGVVGAVDLVLLDCLSGRRAGEGD